MPEAVSVNDPSASRPAAGVPSAPTNPAFPSPHSALAAGPPAIPDHELLRCIGHGSFGEVWLARTIMGSYRGVKIVYRHAFDHPRPYEREFEGIRRFEPVSRRHESQLAVLHVGRNDEAGYFYYVMELADDAHLASVAAARESAADGFPQESAALSRAAATPSFQPENYVPRTLKHELHQRGRLPVDECLRIGLSLTTALAHLHGHGLIHRDIKLSNIIFVEGIPKLADIGLVSTLDATMSISGTPGYIPPEGSGTPQADIYSLGRVLYEMSMGRDRNEFPKLPAEFATLPERRLLLELNAVLVKAGYGDPARRYQTAAEMHADLALIRSGKSVERLRRIEHHLALAKRVAIGVLAISALVAGAWWQAWRAHRISTERLVQLQVKEGTQQIVHGNYLAALPWLNGALQLDAGKARNEETHRMRIASVLRQCPMPVGVFSSGKGPILAADLSADGQRLATANEDWTVRLWDTQTGNLICSLPHHAPVHFCQFLRSGHTLLTWSLRTVWLWNLEADPPSATPVPHCFFNAPTRGSYCLGFNAKLGIAYLSKAEYRFARMHPFTGPYEQIGLRLGLRASDDGVTIRYQFLDQSRGGAVLFEGEFSDTAQSDSLAKGRDTPPIPYRGTLFLLLSDFAFAERTNDSSRVVWDNVRMRSFLSGTKPPDRWDASDDFSQDLFDNWWIVESDGQANDCRIENGQMVLARHRLPLGQNLFSAVCLIPMDLQNGHTLEVEADLVGAYADHPVVEITLNWPHMNEVSWRPVLSPDGQLLAVNQTNDTVRLWDLARNQFQTIFKEEQEVPLELSAEGRPWQVHFSPDSRYLAAVTGIRGDVVVWDVSSGQRVGVDLPVRQGFTQARFSPDSRFLILAGPSRLWLVESGVWRLAHTLDDKAEIGKIALSPLGYRLAAVRDTHAIAVWDLSEPARPPVTIVPPSSPQRIAFSPDGRYLAGDGEDGLVRLWKAPTGRLAGPPLRGRLGLFSADGSQLLVLVPESGVWLWDLDRMMPMAVTVPPVAATEPVASSADGNLRVELQGAQALLRNTRTDLGPLNHDLPLRRASFSADSRYLITETSDLSSWLWNVADGTLMAPPLATRYDAAAPAHPRVVLPRLIQDREILDNIAALLGGQQFNVNTGMKSIPPPAMQPLFNRLKAANPLQFTSTLDVRRDWHRREAMQCEWEGEWEGAVFHIERATEGGSLLQGRRGWPGSPALPGAGGARSPGAPQLSHTDLSKDAVSPSSSLQLGEHLDSHLAYARRAAEEQRASVLTGRPCRSVIPPRPPWALPEMLDLTGLYTQALTEDVVPAPKGNSFSRLPSGVQRLGKVFFDVRGLIRLACAQTIRIPLARPCQRIHFLHAASGPATSHREIAGTYQITYATGERVQVELMNPEDLPPYSTVFFLVASSITTPSERWPLSHAVAWSGINAEVESRNETLFLIRTTWELPAIHRDRPVTMLELRAGSSGCTPLIFAITLE